MPALHETDFYRFAHNLPGDTPTQTFDICEAKRPIRGPVRYNPLPVNGPRAGRGAALTPARGFGDRSGDRQRLVAGPLFLPLYRAKKSREYTPEDSNL